MAQNTTPEAYQKGEITSNQGQNVQYNTTEQEAGKSGRVTRTSELGNNGSKKGKKPLKLDEKSKEKKKPREKDCSPKNSKSNDEKSEDDENEDGGHVGLVGALSSMDMIKETIVQSMKAGFSELASIIKDENVHVGSKRSQSTVNHSPTDTKRPRHDSLSEFGEDEQSLIDVEHDIENLLKEKNSEDDEVEDRDTDIFGDLEDEYDLDEKCGPPVQEKLAGIVNKMARTKLNDELLKEKLNKSSRPKNCENLILTKVNPEIWGKITSKTRSRDLKLQRIQSVLLKATAGLVQVADKLCKNDKETTLSVINSIALITHANCDLNHRRRDLIKPDLNRSYQQICSEQLQVTNFLFGDDLTQKIKDINTTNRVGNQVLDQSRSYKSSRYGQDTDRKSYYSKNGRRSGWKGQPYRKSQKQNQYSNRKKEEERREK